MSNEEANLWILVGHFLEFKAISCLLLKLTGLLRCWDSEDEAQKQIGIKELLDWAHASGLPLMGALILTFDDGL